MDSIEVAAAGARATEAGDLVVLEWELVVVGDLLAGSDLALRVDHNFLRTLHLNHLRVAVWLQRMFRKYSMC